jgi:hypothetical protein
MTPKFLRAEVFPFTTITVVLRADVFPITTPPVEADDELDVDELELEELDGFRCGTACGYCGRCS